MPLLDALKDDYWEVRLNAAKVLAKFADYGSEVYSALILSKDVEVGAGAYSVLITSGLPHTEDFLIEDTATARDC